MSRRVLGRGLDALIPSDSNRDMESVDPYELNINLIDPNPDQPREDFNREKIEELARSINRHGILQPIIVRKKGNRYIIIAGERRWRAAKLLKFKTIPAIIKDTDEKQMYMMALVENIQREDLDPIEEARGIKRLMDEYGLTQEDVSDEVGKSRSAIANTLRLLNLPQWIQKLIREDALSSGHGRAILGLKDKAHLKDLVAGIIEKSLSVRETELLVKQLNNQKEKRVKPKGKKPGYLLEIESILEDYFGTKVSIVAGRKKSTIQIEYYDDNDLQRIMDILSESI